MRVVAAAVGLSLISACTPSGPWVTLHSMDALRSAFERDEGNARIVLLLSPT